MEETKPEIKRTKWDSSDPDAPKWDYTTNEQNLFIGALVVGLNLLVILLYVLYRTVPGVHTFVSGKPI